ncbi:MAG: cation:proton antiporter regulatory subunit [Acidimicrobiales bacterium]
MHDVEETELPGVGTKFDFATEQGGRVGVLVHRGGDREVLHYSKADPDACSVTMRLSEDEAAVMARLLGATVLADHLHKVTHTVSGVRIDWHEVLDVSPLAGRSLGDLAIHTRTGVSIVAILRGSETLAAPGAEAVVEVGDTLVAIGTAEGIEALDALADG